MHPRDPRSFLVKLTQHSAAAWHALLTDMFPGAACLKTSNSTYRFEDGVLVSHGRNAAAPDASSPLVGLHLLGFLVDEGGFCSLSPKWRPGAHAVLWNPEGKGEQAFTVTSLVVAFAIETAPRSGVVSKVTRPGAVSRRSAAASVTRLHVAGECAAR